ncbi:MAG: nucleoside-diphosphate sugar epimerase/dehydratase [Termitinemataceae bacterium]|nr:MAG: nucleoside-diphosphate sugar epimerase/dehydratase [Termitinemataceae bacterium]
MPAKKSNKRRLYIIGAGFAGRTLANEIKNKSIFGKVVAFLEDDRELIGQTLDDIPVLGPIRNVARLLRRKSADEAFIALPGASGTYLKELYGILQNAGFQKIRILPGISQVVDGEAHLIQMRSVDPQDLLGRTQVAINLKESLSYLRGKRVLVTGAGGSIGSELCRQLLSGGVERLYLFGHGENSIYQIDHELRLLRDEGVGEKTTLVPVIGELKDRQYIDFLLKRLKADAIFHTAAYKHVPLMEENPVAVIENNFFGTLNIVDAAKNCGVKRFVLISTDKAVDPVSVYGVSKQLCEWVVLNAAGITNGSSTNTSTAGGNGKREAFEVRGAVPPTNFMVVRFGNVLGSRGSIVPLFQKQIEKGGPLTVTHPDMKRWFMSIPEACSLVLKAGGVGDNGALYLLDMGCPVRILDIAQQMIRFNGFEPGVDIKIDIVGLRAGEKLDERLWAESENPVETKFSHIKRIESAETIQKLAKLSEITEMLRPICFFDGDQGDKYRNAELLRTELSKFFCNLRVREALN